MSYTPTQWATGDTVTAEKLNKMEQGIASAADPFVVTITPTNPDMSGTMDKSPQEIADAYHAGRRILIQVPALGNITGVCTEFIPSVTADDRILVEAWGNFVYQNLSPGVDVFLIVKLRTDEDSLEGYVYDTAIYQLTSMS